MGWVRLEDNFPDHPKVVKAGPLGKALYIDSLCWANRHLTDGFIPEEQVRPMLALSQVDVRAISRLVKAGLWEEIEGGYQIHDYLAYQPSAAKARQARESAARRQDAWRRRRNAVSNDQSNAVSNAVSNTTPSHPNKEQDKEQEKSKRGGARARAWTPPEWFSPLTKLQGYEARDYRKSASKIGVICSEYDVDVGGLVLSFCDYWPVGRIKHEWTSPVRALLTTIDIQIDKLKRVNGRQPNEPRHSGTQLDRIKAEAAEHARRRSATG